MKAMLRRTTVLLLITVLVPTSLVFGQKKKLTVDDYDQWQRLRTTGLSNDGNWFAYQISLVDGDGWVSVKNISSGEETKLMYASRPEFSGDNAWLAFAIGVSKKESDKLKKSKKPVKMKMGLMNLSSAQIDTFSNIVSFTFSDDGAYIALKKYKGEGVKTKGADLILRNLDRGLNQLIGNVAEHRFNDDGSMLAVLLDSHEKLGNGVHLYTFDNSSMNMEILENDEAIYRSLTWHKDGYTLAFMKEHEDKDYEDKNHFLYTFANLDKNYQKMVFNPLENEQFPDGFRIASERRIHWSDDAETIFFGIKEWESKEKAKQDKLEEEAAKDEESKKKEEEELDPPGVDVWHWRDARLQPMQKVRASSDKRFTYLTAWHLKDNHFVRLTDDKMRTLALNGGQKSGIGYDSTPYEPALREQWQDVYSVDTKTGSREKILERFLNARTSKAGKYILYFKDNNWWTYNIATNAHTNITKNIATKFNNYLSINGLESNPPFGSSLWEENDKWVLIYDRYDVYKVYADGSKFERLTNGNDDQVRYRAVIIDRENNFLTEKGPIYLSVYGDFTKESGYYKLQGKKFEKLAYGAKRVSNLSKAKDAEKFVYLTQREDTSPNYYLVNKDFSKTFQLTDTNPQQNDYYWGHSELITFTSKTGDKAQGKLLYPANYQEGRKYPMIVYIYELRSQSLHSYTAPSETRAYNQRRFSTEGFFVFEPDIRYRLRDPGVSAVEYVVPAVKKVLQTGMIDEKKIGLTGHSWGAYQTAFIITQTDMFSAAVAGAPLTNMISMYNSVYWNSGNSDANIFEISQGRFPKPYWEDWDKFVENSPIFNVQNTNTPLLVAFGDNDGAVDFNQGVELYNTMRRMEKPFVMLVYEGENHGLAKKENQIDYANRTHEWFRHYLLGEEPARWITEGVPYLEKPSKKK